MKFSILSGAVFSVIEVNAYIKSEIFKSSDPTELSRREHGHHISVPLQQSKRKHLYRMNITIGTPGQHFSLHVDTGSTDVWIPSLTDNICSTHNCSRHGGFNALQSSTFQRLEDNTFHIQYADRTHFAGDYVSDTINIGGVKVENLVMGLVESGNDSQGLIGLGFGQGESGVLSNTFPKYPTLLRIMKDHGYIRRMAYSIWLNDIQSSSGNLLFGGIDKAKFYGHLIQLPMITTKGIYNRLQIPLTKLSLEYHNGGKHSVVSQQSVPALLDTGSTITYLPFTMVRELRNRLGAHVIISSAYVPCTLTSSVRALSFEFGHLRKAFINVPINNIIERQASYTTILGGPRCRLLVEPHWSKNDAILGDNFLRAAYVVFDLENRVIALARSVHNSTKEDIIDLPVGSGIPNSFGAVSTGIPVSTASKTQLEKDACIVLIGLAVVLVFTYCCA